MGNRSLLKGYYTFEAEEFIPHGDMELIIKFVKDMKLLSDSGLCNYGSFYFNPTDNSYWQYVQYEDYRTELRPVTREFIEENYPTVDCDKLLDVDT